ncbi:porin [Methylomonas fluvii]|uniref:Porin n=1 Tax=Methylomonas fluvii TaxID=1854564 RepID=A0ABR9DIT5_9GAMM|nr:porin [Methylomonas fluvii]MBD9362960.1 porin [Methylomonas fluvii]
MPHSSFRTREWLYAAPLLLAMSPLPAEERAGLLNGLSMINDLPWMKAAGLRVHSWADAGIVYNANDPGDGYNGPVVFADRANEFNLHQLGGELIRDVNTGGDHWDVGGKLTLMYGSDARFNTINPYGGGHWDNRLIGSDERFYKLAIPNAYLDIFTPIGKGLTTRIGRFYTIMGYETGLSPDNFFYTHPYTFQYGEPFTHFGMTTTYPVHQNLSVTLGAVTGGHTKLNGVLDGNGAWDGFDKNMENWNFLGGATWTSDDAATSFTATMITGDVNSDNNLREFQRQTGINKRDNRTFYSLVLQHNFAERWHYVLQHDHGIEQQHPLNNFADAEWYGIHSQMKYDVTDTVGVGLRGEWFRDDDGVRVGQMCPSCAVLATGPANYYAATLGVNWKPAKWLMLRPEARYDWSEGVDAYDERNKDSQFIFGADVVVTF